jgi:hypothetical protein
MITAILYTLVFVLALPVLADAECSWVLWQEAVSGSGRWALSGMQVAFSTKAQCEKQRDARFAYIETAQKVQPGPTPFFVCLPDTVDPGGPKGK